MAIPTGAPVQDQPMDPGDIVEYVGMFDALFEEGEIIDTIVDVTVLPDAAAIGVTVLSGTVDGVNRGPFVVNDVGVEICFKVDEAHQADAAYFAGVQIGIQTTVWTNQNRQYQRTMAITGRQQ